jgi:hypothetical protein
MAQLHCRSIVVADRRRPFLMTGCGRVTFSFAAIYRASLKRDLCVGCSGTSLERRREKHVS